MVERVFDNAVDLHVNLGWIAGDRIIETVVAYVYFLLSCILHLASCIYLFFLQGLHCVQEFLHPVFGIGRRLL